MENSPAPSSRAQSARSLGRMARLRPTARNLALKALLLLDTGLTVQQALARVLAAPQPGSPKDAGPQDLPPAERNLCSELAYGCLRHEIRIAFVLEQVLSRPRSLPRPMFLVLSLAVYGLLFQEKVPDHACVHQAVESVRTLYGTALSRVANACLRTVQRRRNEFSTYCFYKEKQNPVRADSLFFSLPEWIVRLWNTAYGTDAARRLLQRSLQRPWSALRINAARREARTLHAHFLAQGEPVGPWGVAFAPGSLPSHILQRDLRQWEESGDVSFQAAGSQTILDQLGLNRWQGPIWDACAGFGGKTAALLEWGQNVRLATDASLSRLRALPGQCRRLGLPAPAVALADARRPPLRHWEGNILLDVPCSGLGVLARRPDLRRRSHEAAVELVRLQAAMLARAARLLQPGFCLAYITCTLNPAENEKNIEAALLTDTGLRLEQQWQTDHAHPWLEGMYGAVLRRV